MVTFVLVDKETSLADAFLNIAMKLWYTIETYPLKNMYKREVIHIENIVSTIEFYKFDCIVLSSEIGIRCRYVHNTV